jgi:hypothetical protein
LRVERLSFERNAFQFGFDLSNLLGAIL